VDQTLAAKVVQTTIREDLSTSLELHGLAERHTSVLGQELRSQTTLLRYRYLSRVGLGILVKAKRRAE
jgi:hypothetical protein